MNIQSVNSSLINFKNNKNKKILEKRAYIETKTRDIEELCDVMCLGALSTGFLNTDELGKLKKTSKWCKGFIIAALGLLIIKFIKQIQLSKQYDKEFK